MNCIIRQQVSAKIFKSIYVIDDDENYKIDFSLQGTKENKLRYKL